MKLSPVAKAVVTAIGTLAVIAGGYTADNVINTSEGVDLATQIALAALTVYGVYKTRNKPTRTEVEPPANPFTDEGYAR